MRHNQNVDENVQMMDDDVTKMRTLHETATGIVHSCSKVMRFFFKHKKSDT